MKFWNDKLRICPKCKSKVELENDEQMDCPKCGNRVWFFNYRKLKEPAELPPAPEPRLWKDPTTKLLLASAGLFALVALFGIANGYLVASVCSLAAIGFAVFGFIRHAEAQRIEELLAHANELQAYAKLMRSRVTELTRRYVALLQTGDARIEHYFDEIYAQADKARRDAKLLREDARADREAVASVESRIYAMAERLIQDHMKWTSSRLRADVENYQRNKAQLTKAFDFVESIGYRLPKKIRSDALAALKSSFAEKVREQALKDEQRLIKAQMREEARVREERERAIREAEERELLLQQQLEKALREHTDAHDATVAELQRQLAEAQASSERAKSMAQLTKAGHVYILSNIGSFGPDVFKVGMTRRLEPLLRVKELGDASVPFPFDVHAMFSCDNAPTLENALHRELTQYRVNRINLRKEYFKIDLDTIIAAVERHHGIVEYVAEPEALEFYDSEQVRPEELIELEEDLAAAGIDIDDEEDV